MVNRNRNKKKSYYLLQANEQAAAEKQLAIQPPTEFNAGKATQLRAAPIVKYNEGKEFLVQLLEIKNQKRKLFEMSNSSRSKMVYYVKILL